MRRRARVNPRGHFQWKNAPARIQNIPRTDDGAHQLSLPFPAERLVLGALFTSTCPLQHIHTEKQRTEPPTLSISYYDPDTVVLRNAMLMYVGTVRVAQMSNSQISGPRKVMVVRHTFIAGNAKYIIDLKNVSPVD